MAAKWIVVFLLSPFIGLLSVATIAKYREVRRVRAWASTHGRIVRSRAVQREVSKLEGTATRPEVRNFAAITFEFDAGGRKMTGTRVGVAEDLGNFGVEDTLARYPVGKRVEVFFDPADPRQAVLERTLPTGTFQFMGLLIAGLMLVAVAAAIGMDALTAWLRSLLSNPAATPFVVAFSLFALVSLAIAIMMTQESRKAASWPATQGRIIASGFDTFRTHSVFEDIAMSRIVHRARIRYDYKVGDIRYESERVSLGVYKHASLKFLVGGDVRRYKTGDAVTVYYDPANPTQALLNRSDMRPPVLFALAALFAATAIWASLAR